MTDVIQEALRASRGGQLPREELLGSLPCDGLVVRVYACRTTLAHRGTDET
jgi:hypothetical protein